MFNMRAGLVLSIAFLSLTAIADPADSETRSFLNDLYARPSAVMDRLPKKKGASLAPFFSAKLLTGKEFVARKDKARKKQFPSLPSGGRSEIQGNDLAQYLVDNGATMVTKIADMNHLRNANLEVQPWSSDYWPLFQGALGKRYNDPSFPTNWQQAKQKVTVDGSFAKLLSTVGESSLDLLSPAEKYDLLVGNKGFEFTHANFADGGLYAGIDGKTEVETWMGLCHGWAPAAYMVSRPQNAVTVTAADGMTKLKFYPSDIKALATRLWANAPYQSKFSGGRCNDKNPPKDANGRIVSQQCFDTNPGTFHLALVNQIGVSKRSFVMDATFDYQVWNQPIQAYSFKFFNPETRVSTTDLASAVIPMTNFTKDLFKTFRSPKAVSVVGVAMEVAYIVEVVPSAMPTDSPSRDGVQRVVYYYDLELDSQGSIIGGEWYQNAHPDFLWTPAKNQKVGSSYEVNARGAWNTQTAMPASWQQAAYNASIGETLPLAKIVDSLVLEAQLR